MPHVVVAPDKFKGSLTAAEVARHVAAGLRRAVPGLSVATLPVADGGEGTLDAVISAGFRRVPVRATGPTGEPVDTAYAERDGTAVVELADVSGLARLPGGRPDPLRASSRGTGEVMAAALDAGCARLVLGIGGSACTDGGAGMVQALGGVLLDRDGNELPPGGAALRDLARIDLTGLHPRLREVELTVACDVDNPLLGPRGAAAVYGPQKGAGPAEIAVLDAGLARWAELVTAATGADRTETPGAGAAGGVGFAAVAVLGATLRPGIALLLDVLGFRPAVKGAALVVTGEGSLDAQTLHGKAPAGVAAAAREHGVPVVAVAGRCTLTAAELARIGIDAAYPLTDLEPDPDRCMAEAGPLLERAAELIAARHLRAA
ncbi:glycerate kinase [Thermobispora bispora]|jgi:glycerate 2-kinase|uniref:Glycerate kinase n=1 Tax=Thermobispora bispora (strain ATCC 19993 / DSM 43833 / CBS 139.67 / JCM 10125 / KCTC 9307 / NBRC 14880 / R51) TaxID=469371 RepID=D6Y598_THEBD|nr:glycerate kinase [Thermobispora bispora]ADG89293.1 glycerate kinase [Thermobispora bispora DSM 43833]MBO2473627.1 glycerate kinase [Actinomycetales bacterium]QSI48962.1 glycerate kinase [Thermobispora bispora]